MSWDEFSTLLSGLNDKTPLGRVVSIRAETDSETVRNFSVDERRIRNDWAKFKAERREKTVVRRDSKTYKAAMEQIQAAFRSMAGGD